MEPGGLWWSSVLNSALPPQRHSPDAWVEHQDPVSHTAQKKRDKKRKKKNWKKNNKIKTNKVIKIKMYLKKMREQQNQ